MIIETVGVGQVEVEIAGEADTTVVVVNPGWGDAVQANKAGLMEIADVFVINKADRAGVDETRRDLEQMLDCRSWRRVAAADRGDRRHRRRGHRRAVGGGRAHHRAHLSETGELDEAPRAPARPRAATRSSSAG